MYILFSHCPLVHLLSFGFTGGGCGWERGGCVGDHCRGLGIIAY